ncbi:sulfite reductase, partial [Clostridium novyi]|uniref:sulfite reductase n=1 Tax=Clostridium novyi TaxID=1542 RepID=UPI00057E6168
MNNPMMPSAYKILDVKHETEIEYTFKVEYNGVPVKNGQFFEISIPKVGEAPISVSDYEDGYLEFTIRKVGKLTNSVFNLSKGDCLFLRGPYGNSLPIEKFKNKNLVIIAGGTGVSPVRSLIKYFYRNNDLIKSLHY